MSKDVRQPLNNRYARIQKRRSESVRPSRGWRRCRTSSCWRRQRLSTTALAASRQQRPTANSETLTSPACCRTSRRLMLLSVVKEKASRLQFCALQEAGSAFLEAAKGVRARNEATRKIWLKFVEQLDKRTAAV